MKLKKTLVTQAIAGSQIIVPIGDSATEFNGFVRNNETAAFIVDAFKTDSTVEEVAKKLTEEYEVDFDTAKKDVQYVVDMLSKINAWE